MLTSILSQSAVAYAISLPFALLLVKATIILVAALAVTLAMRSMAAGARHLIWLVTLGALLLVPVLGAWSPIRIAVVPMIDATTSPSTQVPAAAPLQAPSVRADGHNAVSGALPRTSHSYVPASAPETTKIRAVSAVEIALVGWGAIALAILASLAGATLSLRRIVGGSEPLADEAWLRMLWDVSDRLGLAEPPRLLRSAEARMPFACGLLHPTIVLPAECDEWTVDRRRAVLLHELAHVKRRDLIGHTVGRIACALYWFHPLVWTAAKRLRAESERACDDLALSCGTRAADYAEHLLDIVTSLTRERTPSVALAMARKREFEGRMLAILDPELSRSTPRRWKLVALAGSLGALSVVVGAATPTARVEPHTLMARDAATASDHSQAARYAQATTENPAPTPALRGIATSATRSVLGASVQRVVRIVTSAVATQSATSADPGDRPALLAQVLRTDTSAKLRRVAAWGLARYWESPLAAPALVAALSHDADGTVREMAAWALANNWNASPDVATALTSALRGDADAKVRATAAWALGTERAAGSSTALIAALNDPDADVAMRAEWALGNAQLNQAAPALVAKLSDHDRNVRELTAWVLFRIHDPATIPAIESALRVETDSDVQVADIRALGAMGDNSVAALRQLLESPNARLRSVAVDALAGNRARGPWPWPWPQPRPFP